MSVNTCGKKLYKMPDSALGAGGRRFESYHPDFSGEARKIGEQ